MFRRRIKNNIFSKLRELIWPYMGWRRTFAYWTHRISRLPGSKYSISAGIAFGASVSFTPFVGLHLVLAGLLAWIFRANVLASAIGTLVGNPWTFPFIWLWVYKLGVWMGIDGVPNDLMQKQFSELFGNILTALLNFDANFFVTFAWPIFGPMLLGGIPTGIAVWIAFYALSNSLIEAANKEK